MPTETEHKSAHKKLQVSDFAPRPSVRRANHFGGTYIVETVDDAARIAAPGTRARPYSLEWWSRIWEQACALLNYGILARKYLL